MILKYSSSCFLGLLLDPEDGSSAILRNLGTLVQGFMGSQPQNLSGCYGGFGRNLPRQGGSCGRRAEFRVDSLVTFLTGNARCRMSAHDFAISEFSDSLLETRICDPRHVAAFWWLHSTFNDPCYMSVLTFNICNSLSVWYYVSWFSFLDLIVKTKSSGKN
jgi:hypothetical protein